MKLCKYCKKPGRYDKLLSKVVCDDHGDLYQNIRAMWNAIIDLQMDPRDR